MFAEPLAGWREARVRARRTKIDWAIEVARLLEGRYAECEKVRLVCDNLNTHTKGAFYEVFDPQRARKLARRVEFCYTPKHGSWLNIAENELSILTQHGLKKRIPTKAQMEQEVKAWYERRNAEQKKVDWQFTTADARVKLKRLYPSFQA